jgi:threonyl-tRNA synthetase
VQVAILPISEKVNDYAREVEAALKGAGLRVEFDAGPEKVGAKIRRAEVAKVPYQLVIGQQEAEGRKVAVRRHGSGDQGQVPLDDFIDRCRQEIATRAQPPAPAEKAGGPSEAARSSRDT